MNQKIVIPAALAACLLIAILPMMANAEQTTIFDIIIKSFFPSHENGHIKILNPVSTPTLWGRWETEFETKGTGDLEIQAYGRTFFRKDVEYAQLYCGGKEIDVEKHFSGKSTNGTFFEGIDNGEIIARNWSCEGKAKLVLRILATGHHYLRFSFLGENAYAENFADCTGTDVSPCSCCDTNNMWVQVTAPSGGGTREYAMTYQSQSGTCGTTPYVNRTYSYSQGYTFCPTEGQYTGIENASAAGGAQSCAVYSNDTSTSFNLYNVNWDTDQNWCNCNRTATGCNGGSCWNVGFASGTQSSCCGDDSGEYYRYCSYSAPQTGFPDSGSCAASGDMCCNATTDCVNTAGTVCTSSGGTYDADGDGDVDYCSSNKWYDCYNNAQCVNGGVNYECVNYDCVSYIINGGSGTTCDASNKCLLVTNSAGTVKARFDKSGYVDVKGSFSYSQSSLTPPAGSFIVRSSTTVVLYIDSSGNLATKGLFYQQASPAPSGNDDFIVKDSTGTTVGFIDGATGNMYFKGDLHYNSNF